MKICLSFNCPVLWLHYCLSIGNLSRWRKSRKVPIFSYNLIFSTFSWPSGSEVAGFFHENQVFILNFFHLCYNHPLLSYFYFISIFNYHCKMVILVVYLTRKGLVSLFGFIHNVNICFFTGCILHLPLNLFPWSLYRTKRLFLFI